MGIFDKAKAKLAYEKESWRMGQEHLKQVKKDSPELYVKGYWPVTRVDTRGKRIARKLWG
jgi:hypothetical protein